MFYTRIDRLIRFIINVLSDRSPFTGDRFHQNGDRKSDGLATILTGDIFCAPAATGGLNDSEIKKPLQVAIYSQVGNSKLFPAPSACYRSMFQYMRNDLFLALIELRLYCRGDEKPFIRHPQAFHIIAGAGESNLEVPHVGSDEWLIKAVIEHVIAHTAEAAAAFLDITSYS